MGYYANDASPDAQRQYPIVGSGQPVLFDGTISTAANQTAFLPGSLVRDWVDGDRHYFTYQTRKTWSSSSSTSSQAATTWYAPNTETSSRSRSTVIRTTPSTSSINWTRWVRRSTSRAVL